MDGHAGTLHVVGRYSCHLGNASALHAICCILQPEKHKDLGTFVVKVASLSDHRAHHVDTK